MENNITKTRNTEKKSNSDKIDEHSVLEYRDEVHAEVLADIKLGDYGYKYRMLEGVVMPPYITPERYRYSREIKTRSGDICYVSYPKSGSTWLAYIIVLITNQGEIPEGETLRSCLHWVASSWTYPRSPRELDELPSPRIFKSHMPYGMAVGGIPAENPCKYIYIARNPKDVAVSYYYFERQQEWSGNYNGPWEHWLKMFLDGRVQRGDWFDHVLSWWERRESENILFLRYEDLRRDYETELRNIAKFLGYPLEQSLLEKVMEKTAFKTMSQAYFSNMHEIPGFEGFFRKGQIGSWRNQFTKSQEEKFDRYFKERMQGTGLDFAFD